MPASLEMEGADTRFLEVHLRTCAYGIPWCGRRLDVSVSWSFGGVAFRLPA